VPSEKVPFGASEAQGRTRRYGDRVAVDHVTCSVARGEVFGFLGPNGAGKSRTVRMLTGFLAPSEGYARILGIDMAEDPTSAREHIGVVPEEANVYADLTVSQNVMLMTELYGIARQQRTHRGTKLLEQFGLADRHRQRSRDLVPLVTGCVFLGSTIVSPVSLCAGIVLGAVAFSAVGVLMAAHPADTPSEIIVLSSLVRLPLIFISGVFLPLAETPAWGQRLAPLSPLSYAADLIRIGMGTPAYFSVIHDVVTLLTFSGVLMLIAHRLHRRAQFKA
jgi:hypothetical protein